VNSEEQSSKVCECKEEEQLHVRFMLSVVGPFLELLNNENPGPFFPDILDVFFFPVPEVASLGLNKDEEQ
jgi:hypothetical protein